ncbi:hypothetical protein [Actinorugispora endophytica]|uniref:hypothetical protein n=1 Tax=Actinorugispora endophytica TaxID=1605990 RepID=UPI001061397C|nr:hypothetical protein [Actinorugispora endophytica]
MTEEGSQAPAEAVTEFGTDSDLVDQHPLVAQDRHVVRVARHEDDRPRLCHRRRGDDRVDGVLVAVPADLREQLPGPFDDPEIGGR